MRQSTYLIWSFILCAVGFSVISILVTTNLISNFDHTISSVIQSHPSTLMTKLSKALALLGAPKLEVSIGVVLTIILLIFYRTYHGTRVQLAVSSLVLFTTVNVVTYFSNSILKGLFHRQRPIMHHMGDYSFPSDHAMMAFAFYITAAYLLWEYIPSCSGRMLLTVACITMTVLISLSRIYLNRHYPSDVIAGLFVSGLLLSFIILLWGKLEKQFNE